MAAESSYLRFRTSANIPATVVPNSSTDMLTINTKYIKQLFVQITVAVAALTGFAIKAKARSAAAAAVTLYSAAGAFTSPVGLMKAASGDLTIQGVGSGWFALDVGGIEEVTIAATSGGTATILIEAGGETE